MRHWVRSDLILLDGLNVITEDVHASGATAETEDACKPLALAKRTQRNLKSAFEWVKRHWGRTRMVHILSCLPATICEPKVLTTKLSSSALAPLPCLHTPVSTSAPNSASRNAWLGLARGLSACSQIWVDRFSFFAPLQFFYTHDSISGGPPEANVTVFTPSFAT